MFGLLLIFNYFYLISHVCCCSKQNDVTNILITSVVLLLYNSSFQTQYYQLLCLFLLRQTGKAPTEATTEFGAIHTECDFAVKKVRCRSVNKKKKRKLFKQTKKKKKMEKQCSGMQKHVLCEWALSLHVSYQHIPNTVTRHDTR